MPSARAISHGFFLKLRFGVNGSQNASKSFAEGFARVRISLIPMVLPPPSRITHHHRQMAPG